VDPYFTLNYPHHKGIATNIPYRALLPKDMEGVLVVGLGISAHRDAVPVIRMQPDLQNAGYAAGVAAAMAAKAGTGLRRIDIKALQKHLVQVGNLKESVLTDKDNLPLPTSAVEAAALQPSDPYRDVAVLMAHPTQALPFVKKAYAEAKTEKDKLFYAQVLTALGDGSGATTLIAALEAAPQLDKGWQYRGMGQFGSSMSPLDSLAYALGRIADKRAVPALVAKLRLLKPDSEFSHFRALALALDRIADPAAAGPLAELLGADGIRGQAVSDIERAVQDARKKVDWNATVPRANALRELFLARALFHCGDKDGLGKKVLQEYTRDLRGHLARHAHDVLETAK
jgi:hypothetical protein